jgi:hypothetical protein
MCLGQNEQRYPDDYAAVNLWKVDGAPMLGKVGFTVSEGRVVFKG